LSSGPLDLLLEVQDLDTTINQLEHRRANLPERAELRSIAAQMAELDTRAQKAGDQRSDLERRQGVLEEQIGGLATRRTGLESTLYGARGAAARDMQAMSEEITHLSARQAELEEEEVTLLVEQEPVDAELAAVEAARGPLRDEAARWQAQLSEAESVIDEQHAALVAERADKAGQLPTELRDRYEFLRARFNGAGAARLVGNHCDGCHLELSAVEVDRLRRLPPDEVVTCEECGRILVRIARS
jgi:predicted  nucleic acid-binding Zn-ribbon protein